MDAAGLAGLLDDECSENTMFTPNNAAFTALDALDSADKTIEEMFDNPEELAAQLSYHILLKNWLAPRYPRLYTWKTSAIQR